MLEVIVVILVALTILFGFVVFFGPPYLPTLKKQINTALDMLNMEEGQTLLELGSGDGRVILAAAKRGIRVVGIELNPVLVVFSKIVTWKYRKQVRVVWGSYWLVKWPKTDAIFTFMIGRQMKELDRRIMELKEKPKHLASFAFEIPQKKAIRVKDGIYLYKYK